MNETIFADGLFYNEPHEKAPDFVIGSLSINRDKFIEFLQNQETNEKGYIKIDILKSREGKPYTKLNIWRKDENKVSDTDEKKDENIKDEISPNDVPF